MDIKKPLVALVLIFVLAAVGVIYYFYQQNLSEEEKVVGGSGTIEAEEVRVGSLVGGKVKEIKIEEGSKVKKGDLLVVLENTVLEEQLKVAEAAVEIAEAQLKEAKDNGTEAEIEVAKAQLKQAKANWKAYKVQLEDTRITSPVEGIILSLPVSLGEVVNAGVTVAVVGNLKELKLVVYLSEEKAGKVKVGDKAKVFVDSYPGKTFEGKVSEIATEAEFTPQNIQTKEQRTSLVFGVTISIDNPEMVLKPGQPADVTIEAK